MGRRRCDERAPRSSDEWMAMDSWFPMAVDGAPRVATHKRRLFAEHSWSKAHADTSVARSRIGCGTHHRLAATAGRPKPKGVLCARACILDRGRRARTGPRDVRPPPPPQVAEERAEQTPSGGPKRGSLMPTAAHAMSDHKKGQRKSKRQGGHAHPDRNAKVAPAQVTDTRADAASDKSRKTAPKLVRIASVYAGDSGEDSDATPQTIRVGSVYVSDRDSDASPDIMHTDSIHVNDGGEDSDAAPQTIRIDSVYASDQDSDATPKIIRIDSMYANDSSDQHSDANPNIMHIDSVYADDSSDQHSDAGRNLIRIGSVYASDGGEEPDATPKTMHIGSVHASADDTSSCDDATSESSSSSPSSLSSGSVSPLKGTYAPKGNVGSRLPYRPSGEPAVRVGAASRPRSAFSRLAKAQQARKGPCIERWVRPSPVDFTATGVPVGRRGATTSTDRARDPEKGGRHGREWDALAPHPKRVRTGVAPIAHDVQCDGTSHAANRSDTHASKHRVTMALSPSCSSSSLSSSPSSVQPCEYTASDPHGGDPTIRVVRSVPSRKGTAPVGENEAATGLPTRRGKRVVGPRPCAAGMSWASDASTSDSDGLGSCGSSRSCSDSMDHCGHGQSCDGSCGEDCDGSSQSCGPGCGGCDGGCGWRTDSCSDGCSGDWGSGGFWCTNADGVRHGDDSLGRAERGAARAAADGNGAGGKRPGVRPRRNCSISSEGSSDCSTSPSGCYHSCNDENGNNNGGDNDRQWGASDTECFDNASANGDKVAVSSRGDESDLNECDGWPLFADCGGDGRSGTSSNGTTDDEDCSSSDGIAVRSLPSSCDVESGQTGSDSTPPYKIIWHRADQTEAVYRACRQPYLPIACGTLKGTNRCDCGRRDVDDHRSYESSAQTESCHSECDPTGCDGRTDSSACGASDSHGGDSRSDGCCSCCSVCNEASSASTNCSQVPVTFVPPWLPLEQMAHFAPRMANRPDAHPRKPLPPCPPLPGGLANADPATGSSSRPGSSDCADGGNVSHGIRDDSVPGGASSSSSSSCTTSHVCSGGGDDKSACDPQKRDRDGSKRRAPSIFSLASLVRGSFADPPAAATTPNRTPSSNAQGPFPEAVPTTGPTDTCRASVVQSNSTLLGALGALIASGTDANASIVERATSACNAYLIQRLAESGTAGSLASENGEDVHAVARLVGHMHTGEHPAPETVDAARQALVAIAAPH